MCDIQIRTDNVLVQRMTVVVRWDFDITGCSGHTIFLAAFLPASLHIGTVPLTTLCLWDYLFISSFEYEIVKQIAAEVHGIY